MDRLGHGVLTQTTYRPFELEEWHWQLMDIYILSAVRMSAVTVKQRFTMPRPIPTGRPGHGARPRILYISPFRERGRRLPTGTFIYWVDIS